MRFGRVLVILALLLIVAIAPVSAQTNGFVAAWPQEINSLNPLYTTQTFAGYTYQLFLAPAWWLDADLNPVPALVTEIPSADNGGISEDGTTFTLTLKEGMTWSDGDPLDSADFVFTYDMILAEENQVLSQSPYDRIAGVEAPDATTVVITFEEPYAPWLGLFTYVLPEHILGPIFEADGTLLDAPFNLNPTVGSGPFVPVEVDITSFARFEANESYVLGRPNIDTIVIEFIPDDQAYLANLLTGDVQLGTFVPYNDVPNLRDEGINVEIIPSGYNEGLFFNVGEGGNPALQDVRVREAVALGIDRATINVDLNADATFVPSGYWENTPYDNPDLEPVPYDPDRARELLDEAGWVSTGDPLVEGGDGLRTRDGVELEIRYSATTRQIRQDIQAVAQQQLGELGIRVVIENYPGSDFFAGYADGGVIATGNYDLAEWSSSPDAFPDPNTARFTCGEVPSDENPSGGNWNYYCNPDLDALYEVQLTQTDSGERIATWHEIDSILREEYIWVGIWHDADVWVINPSLQNVNLNGVQPFWDVQNWEVAN